MIVNKDSAPPKIVKPDSGDIRDPNHRDPQKLFAETQGNVIDLRGVGGLNYDIAIDRETGVLLVADSYHSCLIQNGLPIDCKTDFLPGLFYEIYLASAGDHGFHAVVQGRTGGLWGPTVLPLYYLEYRNDGWSSPIEVGNYCGEWRAWELRKLISDRSGRALFIWPKKGKKLATRWIEPIRQH